MQQKIIRKNKETPRGRPETKRTTNFTYMTNGTSISQQSTPSHHRKNRQRMIIWFNPPYSRNVQTNVGKTFLGLITRHFPASHKYLKIFNKNTVKVSYSCMDNMERIIKKHNQNANQIVAKKVPALWRTTVSLPASCTTLELQRPKTPCRKELQWTNGRTLQTTLHPTRAIFSEPTLRQHHGTFKIYLASQGQ